MFKNYLKYFPDALKYIICAFRTHTLPIETGHYTRIPRNERSCKICGSGQLEDEFHFCMECPPLNEFRIKFLPVNLRKQSTAINVCAYLA